MYSTAAYIDETGVVSTITSITKNKTYHIYHRVFLSVLPMDWRDFSDENVSKHKFIQKSVYLFELQKYFVSRVMTRNWNKVVFRLIFNG